MTASAAFNNGRSQINPNDPWLGNEYPFLNHFKAAGDVWFKHDNSGTPDPSTLDSNGYPISLVGGVGLTIICFIPPQSDRPGNYVFGWTGNGTIDLSLVAQTPSAGFSSADLTSTTGSGRYKCLPTDTSINFGISAIGSPRITSLYLCHEDDETALLAGDVFQTKFKQRLAEAGFGVIRSLNWCDGGNNIGLTNWASRKPLTYFSWVANELRPSLWAGTTTNSSNAYAITSLPGTLIHSSDGTTWGAGQLPKDKDTIHIKFNASATKSGTCSLNLSSGGALNILNMYSNALSVDTNTYPEGASTTNLATLVFDATLNAWIKRGGDTAANNSGIINGPPPEIFFQLCAEMGAHPYFTTPVMAADPFTDYMPSLAAYCFANAPSWMIPRFEGPNETWNSRFPSTNYGVNKATAYGWPDGSSSFHRWYGKVLSVLGQALATVYNISNLGKTYHCICGVQLASCGSSANDPRLSSASYIGTTPQSPYSATAGVAEAWRWVSHGCTANYMIPALWSVESALATAYNSGAGDQGAPIVFADSLLGSGNPNAPLSLSEIATLYAAFKTWLQSFSINRMCGYEGGYSPDFSSGFISSPTDFLRLASKSAPNLRGYLIANYTSFTKLSDATFTAEFPSCFQLGGGIINGSGHTGGAWSVLDPNIYAATSPQWEGIKAWNSVKRANPLRLRIHG